MSGKPQVVRRGRDRVTLMKRVRKKCEKVWSGYQLARLKAKHRRAYPQPLETRVAFVLGCQRSGTNMTLWTLERCLDIDVVEESDPRAFRSCRIMDRGTRSAVAEASDARCVVFKPICDSHRALELYAEHPSSRGIWIYRHYRDVVNSAVEYWGDQSLTYVKELVRGGGGWGVAQWNREGISEETMSMLAESVSDDLTVAGAAALFWMMRNRTYFDQSLQANPDTLLVRYEDVVTDPVAEFRRMCRFLDVEYGDQMVSKVFSSSVRKRPSPNIGAAIEARCESLLAELDRVCASGKAAESEVQVG